MSTVGVDVLDRPWRERGTQVHRDDVHVGTVDDTTALAAAGTKIGKRLTDAGQVLLDPRVAVVVLPLGGHRISARHALQAGEEGIRVGGWANR